MIKERLALCSETIVVDQASNAVSAINIFDDTTPEGYPFLFQKITFLVVTHKEADDPKNHDVLVNIKLNDKVLFSGPAKIEYGDKNIHRFIWGVGGLLIFEPGILKFELSGSTIPTISYQMDFALAGPKEIK